MKNALVPLTVLTAALAGAACSRLAPCSADADCGPAATCAAGSCVPLEQGGPGGEGERDPLLSFDALVVLPGIDALAGRSFTLPLALDPAELAMETVGVDDCTVALTAVDAAATFPVSLVLTCTELRLGALVVPLSLTGASGDVEVSLTVRLVPSDWLDLERSERELISVDTNGLLHDPTVPAGAPVFLAADRIPTGALEAAPRLLTIEGGAPVDVAFEPDGDGLWFALPSSARVWLYYAPVTGDAGALLTAAPWQQFVGVWHLEDDADASIGDGADDLNGTATPTDGVIGGAAAFAANDGLAAAVAHAPDQGALSAWVKVAPVTARARQVAVGVGCELAEGAFDPESVALYTDAAEQACGFVGAGDDEAVTQQCSTEDPGALADGGWHHVAVRWLGTARELVVDGESATRTGPIPSSYDLEVVAIGSAIDLGDPWIGDVDEVRFSTTALPASWFQVEHASVTGLTTDAGRPFVLGLRPDVQVDSEVVTSDGAPLAPVPVVPALSRGVLVAFVAARGAPADGARFDDVALSRLAPSAEGSDLSLTALSYEGSLDGAPLTVTHAGAVPPQAVVGTLAFPGGTERGLAGVNLAAEPVVVAGPRLALAAAPASAGAAWIVVAVASRQGVARCDACGRHMLGPIEGGAGLVLDVFAGEREPTAHVLEPIVAGDDAAAVVVVRVGP
ncbi:MAG: LamG domain-containing protein [Deltaproteobacteria bacterium]|nr:LamG domain-containing protein [Deltaproteobacteria bacterium]